jgi:hypothetical protein
MGKSAKDIPVGGEIDTRSNEIFQRLRIPKISLAKFSQHWGVYDSHVIIFRDVEQPGRLPNLAISMLRISTAINQCENIQMLGGSHGFHHINGMEDFMVQVVVTVHVTHYRAFGWGPFPDSRRPCRKKQRVCNARGRKEEEPQEYERDMIMVFVESFHF